MTLDELRLQLSLLKDGSRPVRVYAYGGLVELKKVLIADDTYIAEFGYIIDGELFDTDEEQK